jgi:hypothetical protein
LSEGVGVDEVEEIDKGKRYGKVGSDPLIPQIIL